MQNPRFVQSLYNKAELIGNNKKLLLKRLKEGFSILISHNPVRKVFGKYIYDFENKRLVSENGKITLQWYNNGHTSEGLCRLTNI